MTSRGKQSDIARIVDRERVAQALPLRVCNPIVLGRLAAHVRSVTPERENRSRREPARAPLASGYQPPDPVPDAG
ncbi:MAG: hypothetical protein ACRD1G_10075 [Acidimicrobiales bacterium]